MFFDESSDLCWAVFTKICIWLSRIQFINWAWALSYNVSTLSSQLLYGNTALWQFGWKAERSEQRALWNHILVMFTLLTWKIRCSSITVDPREHNRLFSVSHSQIFESCVLVKVWLCFFLRAPLQLFDFAVSRALWAQVKTQALSVVRANAASSLIHSTFFPSPDNIAHRLSTTTTNRLGRYSAKTHACKTHFSCCRSERSQSIDRHRHQAAGRVSITDQSGRTAPDTSV